MLELVGREWREFVGVLCAVMWGFGLVILSGVAYFIRVRKTLQLVLSIPTVVLPVVFYL